MKTMQKFLFLFLLLFAIVCCKDNKSSNDYLRKVLSNLEKIESASYYINMESWLPGDTVPYAIYNRFYKEYNNPADSTIGACFVWLNANDTTLVESVYDGNIRAYVDNDKKEIVINDFEFNQSPYRPVSPPFFSYVKSIIRYILETKDSITLVSQDLGDSYYFNLTINENHQVEFFGKAYYMPEDQFTTDNTSMYKLWISKSNDLPYKYRKEMSQRATVGSCSKVEINKLSIKDFNIYNCFPADYAIRKAGERTGTASPPDLTGKIAPDWTLTDGNGQTVSLADFKSKVLIINLTGIGCGPCKAAIPFLNGLRDKYGIKDVEIASVECWKKSLHAVQYYANSNKLNYKLLSANEDFTKNYQANGAVPVYIILDKQRIVKKIIRGYELGTTDKEITDAIDLYLK